MSWEPDPDSCRAVLIGTATYRSGKLSSVPEITRTVQDLRSALTDANLGLLLPNHCRQVLDPSTREEIGDPLHEAADAARDIFLVYYTGHGITDPHLYRLHLALTGTDPDKLGYSAQPYAAIRDTVQNSTARVKIVILDCCFAGRAINEPLSDNASAIRAQLDVEGVIVLAAAPYNEVALVRPGEQYTAFTGRLLHLLRTGIPNDSALITMDSVIREMRLAMSAEGLPVPVGAVNNTAHRAPIARNRAFQQTTSNTTTTGRPREPSQTRLSPLKGLAAASSRLWYRLNHVRTKQGSAGATIIAVLRELPLALALAIAWPLTAFGYSLYRALVLLRQLSENAFRAVVIAVPVVIVLILLSVFSSDSATPQASAQATTCEYSQSLVATASRSFSVPISTARTAFLAVFSTTAGTFTVQPFTRQAPCASYALRYLIQAGFYTGQQCSYFDSTTSGYILDCFDPMSRPDNTGLSFEPDTTSLPATSNGIMLMSVDPSGQAGGILAFSGNNPVTTATYEPCGQVVQGQDVLAKVADASSHKGFLDFHSFANSPFTINTVSLTPAPAPSASTTAPAT